MRPSLERLDQRLLLTGGPLGIQAGAGMYGDAFVDLIKSSTGFFSDNNNPNYANDAQGWPEADATDVIFDNTPVVSWGGADTSVPLDRGGDYSLSFQGLADVTAFGDVSSYQPAQDVHYDPATNTTTATIVVAHDDPFLQLYFNNTQRTPSSPVGSGITDVRLIQPGYAPDTTQLYSNQFLAAYAPFDTLRYMDEVNTNSYGPSWVGTPLEWSQRPMPSQPSLFSSGAVGGLPWEDAIALANATQTNMWINIPGPASDNYVLQLAELLKHGDTVDGVHYAGLDPGLKVYVEWSNEVWGGIYAPWAYNMGVTQAALEAGGSILDDDGADPSSAWWIGGNMLLRNDMLRTMQIEQIFNQVFHDPKHDPIRPVVVWQEGSYQPYEQALPWFESNFGAPSQYFYGIGQANYYSPSDYNSVDDVINQLAAAAQQDNQATLDFTTLATYWGLKNVAYEGGPGMGATDPASQAVLLQALHDPRMEQVVAQSYTDWFADGGDLAMFYGDAYGGWNAQWPWDAAPFGDEADPSLSPKYAGLMDVINSAPIPVTAGIAVAAKGPTTFDANTDTTGNWFNSDEVGGQENGYWLLDVAQAGTYDLSINTNSYSGGTQYQSSTSGDTGLGPAITIQQGGGDTDLGTVTLHAGLNTLYVHTLTTSWGFWANNFTLTPISSSPAPSSDAPQPSDAGFESPAVGAGGIAGNPTGTPWTFVGTNAGVTGDGSGFTAANPGAPEGAQVAFLQETGGFSQQVAGWAAGSYTISFDAAQRGNYNAARQDFEVLVDGAAVGTFTPSGSSYGAYTTAPFSVSAGSHTIAFQALDSAGGDNTAFLDDVRLVPA